MTATGAPSAAVEATDEARRCPRCGAPLRAEQEWCLSCGTGVGARVAAPRGWRWPLVAVGTLLGLVLVALVLALVELAGNAEQVTQRQAQAPTATPTVAATPTPGPSTTATPPAGGGTGGAPQVADWPAGKTGYTVVLESSSTRSAADARAQELAAQGVPVGVLDSSGYATLTPDRFVVFSGQYESRAEARKALADLRDRVTGAKIARVAPA